MTKNKMSASKFKKPLLRVLGKLSGWTATAPVKAEDTYEPVMALMGITDINEYGENEASGQPMVDSVGQHRPPPQEADRERGSRRVVPDRRRPHFGPGDGSEGRRRPRGPCPCPNPGSGGPASCGPPCALSAGATGSCA
jgi:hypothetical protein